MPLVFKNEDLLLKLKEEEKNNPLVYKYDSFLDALTSEKFEHVREAARTAFAFFLSNNFNTTESSARYTYQQTQKLQTHFSSVDEYIRKFKILDKKSYSIDLATGTGKSWVIYAVAIIMLSEGLVDKVLVLCPSLTIEEELKKKFELFSGDQILTKILQELNSPYPSPAIKNANVPILEGDICIENIHAAYQRTGSSISDSFKGKGRRVLVINDEAHHIYSEADSAVKKWYEFLTDPEYDFNYLLGLSGTPYINNDYFFDIIYRYSLKQAMEDEIIKKIDYKVEEESKKEKGFSETYANHLKIKKLYSKTLRPITIIITEKIHSCIKVWDELVKFISDKEDITYEEASQKVIWVTSGLPSNQREKDEIKAIISEPEKARKENLALLKTVDEPDNPVEWIVSVSMLTEGWDVKNVFQIVPHEQRAFNSKLLIAQVLGRGLRIPPGISHPVFVKINNHESWTDEIRDLYNEVLEIENRISWGYDGGRQKFLFPLFNIDYESKQDTIEAKREVASEPTEINFSSQSKTWDETSVYSETGSFRFTVEMQDYVTIDQAAKEIKLFLKSKDENLSRRWPKKKIEDLIVSNLENSGYDSTFLSRENLGKAKQAFGPLFRELGKEVPRMKMVAKALKEIKIEQMNHQSISESSIKTNGKVFFTKSSLQSLSSEQKIILSKFLNDKKDYDRIKEAVVTYGHRSEDEIKFLVENLIEKEEDTFKTPLNFIYASSTPEYNFTNSIFNHIETIDSFIKSPDKNFYCFPYSYKPTEDGSSHVKRENFNPDYFLKVRGEKEILVVEIKKDGDSTQRNKAKYRDGKQHFEKLNELLKAAKINWQYYFYFLSPDDIVEFFQAIRDNRYPKWKSELMKLLS
ncbi:MAG: DEAD/DEAH box helicase family protein [Ignavibacteriales bacterium]|jgi:type III restriction enzyme|nr:DEAD/DEAH box helicase family protein [Ignavibacteriales bacterium]MDX9712491.1 DEAD/DEAH box helicase family protein [Ignavibacteriaceae bacterium]